MQVPLNGDTVHVCVAKGKSANTISRQHAQHIAKKLVMLDEANDTTPMSTIKVMILI